MSLDRPHKLKLLAILLTTGVGFAAAWQVPDRPISAQTQNKPCDCTNLGSCQKPSPTPQGTPTPKKSPLPPIKMRDKKSIYPARPTVINDKDLPGLDEQSGTALDTRDNFARGKAHDYDHCDPCGPNSQDRKNSKQAYYQERRRYIYNTYVFGKHEVANREITVEQFERLKNILKQKLEDTNEQERGAYQEERSKEDAADTEYLNKNIDAQNEERSATIEKQIEAMGTDDYANIEDAVRQVVTDNIRQAAQQEKLGQSGSTAVARAAHILNRLFEKIGKDCNKKPLPVDKILALERQRQLMGGSENNYVLSPCLSRTLVAKQSLPGFELEARKCVSADLLSMASFDGEWQINVVGLLPLQGAASITDSGKGGKWNAKVTLADGKDRLDLNSGGPAQIISGNGQCLLWLQPGDNTADARTEQFRRVQQLPIPITGKFPIELRNETCTGK